MREFFFLLLIWTCSIRVSNELGAGNPRRAKHAMFVSLKLSIILAVLSVLTITFGHDIWVGFFTENPLMIENFAKMTPFLAASIAIDVIQCVLSGSKFNQLISANFLSKLILF